MNVLPQRMILAILQIQLDFFRPDDLIVVPFRIVGPRQQLFFVAKIQGCRARNTGTEPEDLAGFPGKLVGIAGNIGPGSHEGHTAGEHVPELRQLVEFVPPEKPSDRRDSRVCRRGYRTPALRPGVHGPELDRREKSALFPHPLLLIEDGAAGGESDQDGDYQPGNEAQEDAHECEEGIEEAFSQKEWDENKTPNQRGLTIRFRLYLDHHTLRAEQFNDGFGFAGKELLYEFPHRSNAIIL